jgi:hypothetical protein
MAKGEDVHIRHNLHILDPGRWRSLGMMSTKKWPPVWTKELRLPSRHFHLSHVAVKPQWILQGGMTSPLSPRSRRGRGGVPHHVIGERRLLRPLHTASRQQLIKILSEYKNLGLGKNQIFHLRWMAVNRAWGQSGFSPDHLHCINYIYEQSHSLGQGEREPPDSYYKSSWKIVGTFSLFFANYVATLEKTDQLNIKWA